MAQADYYAGLSVGGEALREVGEPAAAATVATALYHRMEGAYAGPPLACAAGCTPCCHFPVGVSFAELQRLRLALAAVPEPERARIDRAIAAAAAPGCTFADLAAAQDPCPLLHEGRCAVHADRPLACRGWNSFAAEPCHQHRRGLPVPVPFDDRRLHLAMGIGAALQQWHVARGLPADGRELRDLLARLPDATAASFGAARTVTGDDARRDPVAGG